MHRPVCWLPRSLLPVGLLAAGVAAFAADTRKLPALMLDGLGFQLTTHRDAERVCRDRH